MGSLQAIPLGHQTSPARSGVVTLERVTNMYAEQAPKRAKEPVTLYPIPGLKLWATVGTGQGRGQITMGADIYKVSGCEIYAIDVLSKAQTLVGTIDTSTGRVALFQNGTHVLICTSGKAYAVNRSGVVELAQSGLNGATGQDGYGIVTKAGTRDWYITNSDDLTTIDPLDFTNADAHPGSVIGCISDHKEPWILCENHAETYWNSGDASFPFVRTDVIEIGCVASGSIAKALSAILWLGRDPSGAVNVYMARGHDPVSITPPWVTRLIQNATGHSGADAWTYTQDGHTFYVISFSDLTLTYDMSTGLWHDRKSDGISRWRASGHTVAREKHLVGDFENSKIYELDLDTYDDDGSTLRREVVSPPIFVNGRRVVMWELYVDFEVGVGLTSGDGSDPQAMLDWTDDGVAYGNEVWAGIGKIGKRQWRASWHRLGSFRQRTLRLAIADKVKVVILGAHARLEVLF